MQHSIIASFPSPPQGVWHLGPVPLRAYGLCIMVGVILGLWLTSSRFRARGGDDDVVWEAGAAAVLGGIIGGRAYHVLTSWDNYFGPGANPLDVFKITNGGLGILGAVLVGTAFVAWVLRRRGVPFALFADAAAPAILLGQAVGRLGNWFNQELYGADTTVPWALEIYQRVDSTGRYSQLNGHSTGEIIALVHPVFLYELLWNLLACVLLIWIDRRFKLRGGVLFALYFVSYSAGRFWIEFMRVDPATHIWGLRINTIVFAVVFLVASGTAYLLAKGSLKERHSSSKNVT